MWLLLYCCNCCLNKILGSINNRNWRQCENEWLRMYVCVNDDAKYAVKHPPAPVLNVFVTCLFSPINDLFPHTILFLLFVCLRYIQRWIEWRENWEHSSCNQLMNAYSFILCAGTRKGVSKQDKLCTLCRRTSWLTQACDGEPPPPRTCSALSRHILLDWHCRRRILTESTSELTLPLPWHTSWLALFEACTIWLFPS